MRVKKINLTWLKTNVEEGGQKSPSFFVLKKFFDIFAKIIIC